MKEEGYDTATILESAKKRRVGVTEQKGLYGNFISNVEPLHMALREGESPQA